mmetsp:Transcript_51058/g.81554  ORF Transcript_51058/g.81554 Transcript_51058/m.81554 type:complete len:210 (+) Transcript_51058:495-1124(+)
MMTQGLTDLPSALVLGVEEPPLQVIHVIAWWAKEFISSGALKLLRQEVDTIDRRVFLFGITPENPQCTLQPSLFIQLLQVTGLDGKGFLFAFGSFDLGQFLRFLWFRFLWRSWLPLPFFGRDAHAIAKPLIGLRSILLHLRLGRAKLKFVVAHTGNAHGCLLTRAGCSHRGLERDLLAIRSFEHERARLRTVGISDLVMCFAGLRGVLC